MNRFVIAAAFAVVFFLPLPAQGQQTVGLVVPVVQVGTYVGHVLHFTATLQIDSVDGSTVKGVLIVNGRPGKFTGQVGEGAFTFRLGPMGHTYTRMRFCKDDPTAVCGLYNGPETSNRDVRLKRVEVN